MGWLEWLAQPGPKTLALAYVNRSLALRKLGRFDEAVEDATAIIALEPDPETSAWAYVNRAIALLNLGRVDEATADFVSVTMLLPATHTLHVAAVETLKELDTAN